MWSDVVAWFQSPAGARVLQSAVIPALAIVVAGVVAGLIGRAAVRTALARADREQASTVVSGLVEAARATADPGPADKDRRRAARLRSEMDVRTRLLPLKGADVAADWAATRISALEQADPQTSTGELDAFRDRLIAWTRAPKKARRLFADTRARASSGPKRRGGSTAPEATSAAAGPAPVETVAEQQQPAPARKAARPATRDDDAATAGASGTSLAEVAAPTSRAAAAEAPQLPEVPGETMDAEPSTASIAVAATPAWRRARAAADARADQDDQPEPGRNEPEPPLSTAPVVVQRRAVAAPSTDADDPVRAEAQQPVRRARVVEAVAPAAQTLEDEPAPVAVAAPPAAVAAPMPGGRVTPAWLDTYDDEVDVTQNLNLKTPPPISATAVRDRTRSGEDIVPRD